MSPAAETGAKAREQRGSPADDRLAAVNPVVFHFNGLGDRLMALPALRALASLFAGRLALIGGAGDQVRFYADVPLREAHEVFCPVVDGGRRFDAAELAGKVGACDLLISLNTWPSPDYERLLAHWPGAASLGFSRSFQSRLRVDHERHACDNYFDLVQALSPSARLTAFAQPPALPEPELRWARSIRERLPPSARLLTLHTETLAEKRWPEEKWQGLLDELLEGRPDLIAFVLDVEEFPTATMRHAQRVFSLPGVPLSRAMALVAASDLFAGVDSCLLHAADLHRVPGVGLFGPTSPRRWGFRFAPHRHVIAENGAMERLEVAAVLEALGSLVA